MPYISRTRRDEIDKGGIIETPGELNYFITDTLLDYLGDIPNYRDFNEAIGVLECCKLELYRRMIAPYENGKKELNGDVFK
jgi:hypothetical protein